jgi:hypothetical protein
MRAIADLAHVEIDYYVACAIAKPDNARTRVRCDAYLCCAYALARRPKANKLSQPPVRQKLYTSI